MPRADSIGFNQISRWPDVGYRKGTHMTETSFAKRLALMGAATAVAAGLAVTVSPTAQAADQWGGIATGQQGQWVIWWGKPDRTSAAYFGNWAKCGAACKRVLLFEECGALAYNGGAFSAAEGSTQQDAEGVALGDLPGGWIAASRCNDGSSGSLNWQGS
jgi:hypothetical protein